MKTIDFYFDFSSPYGYIASHRIDDIAARHGRAVNWRPYLLGVVFKASGRGPLPEQPLVGDYALRDFARSARLYAVPLTCPRVCRSRGSTRAGHFTGYTTRTRSKRRC